MKEEKMKKKRKELGQPNCRFFCAKVKVENKTRAILVIKECGERKRITTVRRKCKQRRRIAERLGAKRDIANCCSRNVPGWKEGSVGG